MHTTIDYSRVNDPIRRACADTLDYLGPKRFKLIVGLIKCDHEKEVDFAFGMVGVSGYPTWAMWKRYNPGALPPTEV